MKTERKRQFDSALLGVIISLAWPTMLEQLMQTAVQYVDTAMVGSLGTQATAAVGSTSTVNWLVSSTIAAIGVGFLSLISRAIGAGEYERARKASAQAALTVLTVGVIVTAVTVSLSSRIPVWMRADPEIQAAAGRYFQILYSTMLFRTASIIFGTVLRAAGDTATPMRVGLVVNAVNVVLNFLLIYPSRTVGLFSTELTIWGAGLGVEGAAMASAVSYAVGGVAITAALWKHETVSPYGQRMRPDLSILKPCFRVAIPNMLQRFATSFGYVAFATMINALGDTATAAHTVANTVESAFYIPGYGMQTAAATLAGNAYGARDGERLKRLSRQVIALEAGLMTVSGGMLFVFAPMLVAIFSRDAEVIALGTTVLRMVAVSEPFYGVSIVIEGMMQGLGKTTAPMVFSVLGMWGVRIAGTFVFTTFLGKGLVAAWGWMIGHNMLLFILFGIEYLSGRWNPMQPKKRGKERKA